MKTSMGRHIWRLIGLCGCITMLLGSLFCPAVDVYAAADGVVEGQVVNETAGGAVPAAMPVELGIYKGMALLESRVAQSDATGRFRFDKLETGQEYNYQPVVHYKGASYFSDIISLATNPKPQPVQIQIYEPTTDFGQVHVERAHVIVEVTPRNLQMAQLYVLTNPGDRVYVGPKEDGSAPTLKFFLPAGATDLQFQEGSLGQRFLSTPDGFVDTEPVLPGASSHQVVYRYSVPFSSTQVTLAMANAYSVTALNVLVSDPQIRLTSPGLQNDGVRNVQNEQWQSLSGQNLAVGQVVQLQFDGLPLEERAAPAPAAEAKPAVVTTPNRMVLWVVFGLLMFGLGFVAGSFGPRLWRAPRSVPVQPAETDLITELADLDDAFERGELDESTYRRERARLKRGPKGS